MTGWLAVGVVLGGALGFWLFFSAIIAMVDASRRRHYRAVAAEHGWEYHRTADLPAWIRELPLPPNATGEVTCRHSLVGTSRGHRVYLADLEYLLDSDDDPEYVCSVIAMLDPPPGLPTVVAHYGVDVGPAVVVGLVESWRDVRMWGIGDVVWTLAAGSIPLGVIDVRVERLTALVEAALAGS